MINYRETTLANGLRVIVHEDPTSALAVVNVLYDVGAKDEAEGRTGFAHLFEHLMFSGSVNIPSYDEPLQGVGGENNAFTSQDLTNYYLSLPAANIETGFWLESDRMLSLAFSEQGLDVQRKVVVEEFKQHYLNEPYGDVWLRLYPAAYTTHPYRWATIGQEVSHIETASMADVRAFFHKHYAPQNAILVVAGGVIYDEAVRLAEKWFGPIPGGEPYRRTLPAEPRQTEARHLEITADVPAAALYKVWHMPGRADLTDYYPADLLSDVLGRGKSSRLYQALVQERQLFTGLSASVSGTIDSGLLVVSGKVREGISIEEADAAVAEVIATLRADGVTDEELLKVRNQAESTLVFGEVELLNRAINLATAKLLGDADLVNSEADRIRAVTVADVNAAARDVLRPDNCTTLYYRMTEVAGSVSETV
ncbi:MAG: insulinase family protein [Hymenobacteraceae bacterium]|nr:insulinase family protein [Hymenobacteraceae bacterium]